MTQSFKMDKEINQETKAEQVIKKILFDDGYIDNVNDIDNTLKLKDDLGMDSLDVVEFTTNIEKQINVNLDHLEEQITEGSIQTVIDIVNSLINK